MLPDLIAQYLKPSISTATTAVLLSALVGCQSTPNVQVATAPILPEANDFREKSTGLIFPPEIRDMMISQIKDFEPEQPGLGKSISYRAPNTKLEIYVYDLGAAIIPNGTSNTAIESAFSSAVANIVTTAKSGIYNNFITEDFTEIELGGQDFLHSRFAYSEDLVAKESHLLVTGFNTQILKIRLTLSKKDFSILDLSLTNNPFTSERKQVYQQIAKIVADARERGFTGVSNEEIQHLQEQLQSVNLDDGITPQEATTIAQVELINQGYATNWDIMQPSETSNAVLASYQTSFPSRDKELDTDPIQILISDNGAVTIQQDEAELQF